MRFGHALASLTLALCLTGGAAAQGHSAGVARADITPKGPIWMSGYASRNKPSEGVDHPLFVKALAIREGAAPPLIVLSADVIGYPWSVSQEICSRLEKELNTPRENILLAASHTHTGPVLAGNLLGMFDLRGKDLEAVEAFTRNLADQSVAAAKEAAAKTSPVTLSYAVGRATFAMNRRVFRPGGVNFGVNPQGPADYSVPVLRLDGPDGQPRAILFGYACHCTTLGGDHFRLSGDYAGFAQDFLERAYPGATALFVTGCGGDANPEPRGKLDYARQHGLELAGAVTAAMKGSRAPVGGPIRAAFDRVQLPLAAPPPREEYEKRAQEKDPFRRRHAQMQLEILKNNGSLPTHHPCPVQVWRFGNDLTLVAIGGEVVVDYSHRLKRELPGNVWVAAYANDVFAYVPSVRILLEGGYEADFNLIYYGVSRRFGNDVEEVLVKKVHELVKKAQQ